MPRTAFSFNRLGDTRHPLFEETVLNPLLTVSSDSSLPGRPCLPSKNVFLRETTVVLGRRLSPPKTPLEVDLPFFHSFCTFSQPRP